ncbi:MAG: DUF1828 domain-containing protein, partial [Planctomycetaceae bacterium]|nr:DUF1828 domain-containing protein [Planctomycetaceae bacterium]
MIAGEIENLLQEYHRWLKDKTTVKKIGSDWAEITTPYLDRHNDCLQIYAKKDSGNFILTDDGYIINDLLDSGCSLDNPKRKKILNTTLAGFGVRLENDTLTIHASAENFAIKKHNIIQAMLAVNDMFYLASPHVENFFIEDVTQWFDVSEVRYTPKVKFSGASGFDHLFDFVIPKSSRSGERLVQVLSNPSKDQVESLVFKWLDTKDTRPNGSLLYTILNDIVKEVPSS